MMSNTQRGLILSILVGLLSLSSSSFAATKGISVTYEMGGTPTFLRPLPNLSIIRQDELNFYVGRSFFRDPWIKAPTVTANRDGLGPHFNMRSCIACHIRGARSQAPQNPEQTLFSTVVRLAIGAQAPQREDSGAIPEPTYGEQLSPLGVDNIHTGGLSKQDGSLDGKTVMGEGRVHVFYQEIKGRFPDGETYSLRRPYYRVDALSYGALHPRTQLSLRVSPQLIGLGLLEAIPEQAIEALAKQQAQTSQDISGRPNRVWDRQQQKRVLGRFGYKADQSTVLHQTAAAFVNDIGITNSLFPDERCTPKQVACLQAESGNDASGVEVDDSRLHPVADFVRLLGVPKRRDENHPKIRQGERLFYQIGCSHCHYPTHVTKQNHHIPELAEQQIWPYTDLLLHDMGPELADGHVDYQAKGSEWRTAPLWGIGLTQQVVGHSELLHDGRARSVQEAILWHGGEAAAIRDAFKHFSATQRAALIAFVNSI